MTTKLEPATAEDMFPKEHPVTGEPFVRGSIERIEKNRNLRHWMPSPPTRAVYEFDYDDTPIYIRDLSDDEYAAELAAYDAALKRWHETGGIARAKGPVETTGSFETASGSTARGVQLEDGSWRWAHVEVSRGSKRS